ncbi:MAG: GreA/GreB family elongation factor [Nitriliruptoraceae bacterium]
MAADMTVRGTPVVLTTAGQAWLEARLARARERLAHIEDELTAERSEELIAERQQVRDQIEELVPLLRDAVAPGDVRDDPAIVELGDEVEVEFSDGERESFLIVHPVEAGMDEHRTASDAPLARAVLGHLEGDQVTVASPAGVYHCTIVGHHRIG